MRISAHAYVSLRLYIYIYRLVYAYLSARFCLTAPPPRALPSGPKDTGIVTSKCLPSEVQSSALLPSSTHARHTFRHKASRMLMFGICVSTSHAVLIFKPSFFLSFFSLV